MTHSRMIAFVVFSMFAASTLAAEAGWGSVKGRIIWKGDVPEVQLQHKKGAAVKDAAVCAAVDVPAQDLVVDKETKGIANIFVYLPKSPKKIHPDTREFDPTVLFDQKTCTFVPHAMVVRAGQTVEVINSDGVAHNTHTYTLRNKGQNVTVAPNTARGKGAMFETKSREILPSQVKCDFHGWMTAYWLILDHPYATVTAEDGTFEIENLPAGKHKFRIWHERVGYLNRNLAVKVPDGETVELETMEYEILKKD